MRDNQLFTRYEFKYLINDSIANILYKDALNFMEYDKFALKTNGYFVRSLYFDNNDYDNFFEKVDGIKFRKKFRIRTYNKKNLKKNPIFLEAKGRFEDRVFKKRFEINPKHLEMFYEKNNLSILLEKYKNNSLVKEFYFDVMRKRISPKILIDYNRKPLINKHGLYFRLTFDSQLKSSKTKSLFQNDNFFISNKCKPGYTILEVKFERSIPVWFHRTIQAYDLKRQSISKFVYGVCNSKIKEETSD